mgnify:CR=1 FL=1
MQTPDVAEFAELLVKNGATIIIGAGVSRELGYPLSHELAASLAQDFGVNADTLESVVKAILDKGVNREEIVKRIREILEEKEKEALKTYQLSNPYFLLAKTLSSLVAYWKNNGMRLAVNIITTNLDRELEGAIKKEFDKDPSEFSIIVNKDDYSKPINSYVQIYKIRGDIFAEDSSERGLIVLTEDDLKSSESYRKALYSKIKGAGVEKPLLVLGYSFKDKSMQIVCEEAEKALGSVPTFYVNPEVKPNIKGATTFPVTSLEFLNELMDYLSTNNGFVDLSAYIDYGIELIVDEELKKAVEDAKRKRVPVVIHGHRYSGKTLTVLRAKKKGIIPQDYLHVELSKHPINIYYIESIKEKLKSNTIIEGSSYQIKFLMGKEKKEKRLSIIFGKGEEQKKSWIPEDSIIVEHKIAPEDAERLFDYFSELVAKKHRGEAGYTVEKIKNKKDHLLELASYGGSPLSGKGLLIPPLLIKVIEDYADKDFEELKKIKSLEKDNEKLLFESFGLSLPEAVTTSVDIGELLNDLKKIVLPILSEILVPAAIGLLGISFVIHFYKENKDLGLRKYIQLYKAWNEYPLEKRMILCEKLDEKYGLNPGESFSFLSSWFSPRATEREYDEFMSKLEKVLTDDFLQRLNETIGKVPELENEILKIKERVDGILKEIESLKEELKVLKAALPLLEIKNEEQLKEELGIKFSVDEKVHDDEFKAIEEQVMKALESPQSEDVPNIIVIKGESGTGKTVLAYRVLSYLMRLSKSEKLNGLKFYKVIRPDAGFTDDSKAVYFMDDFSYNEDWYKIFDINFMSSNKPNGPVIVSVVNFRYEEMLRKIEQYYKHNVAKLESIKKKIKVFEIGKARYDELAVIYDSLLKDLNLSEEAKQVLEEVKDKVIDKAEGIPVIIRFFFDQLKNVEINKETVRKMVKNIEADPEGYVAQRLIDSYLADVADDEEKLRYMLALLKVLSKGNVFITALDRPKGESVFSDIIRILWNSGYLTSVEVKLPLFELDYYGKIRPIHPSVQIAVDRIIERLGGLESRGTKFIDNFADIMMRRFGSIELTSEVDEAEEYIKKSYEEHLRIVLSGGAAQPIYTIPTFYMLNNKEQNEHINEFIRYINASLSKYKNKNVPALLLAFTYEFFNYFVLNIYKDLVKEPIKELLAALLKSGNEEIRLRVMSEIGYLIESGVIKKDEAAEFKQYFIELLKSDNEDTRSSAWWDVFSLIENGILTKDEVINLKQYLIELLKSEDVWIWMILESFIDEGIISREEILSLKQYFIDLLKSEDEKTKLEALKLVDDFIHDNIISREEVLSLKQYINELLKSGDETIRLKAWEYIIIMYSSDITTFINEVVMPEGTIAKYKQYFFGLLKSNDPEIRSEAWEILNDHVIISITRDDSKFFIELLKSNNIKVRIDAWSNIDNLIEDNIITRDEAISLKPYFIELLKADDIEIRSYAWSNINYLIENGILTKDDVINLKQFFIELLKSNNKSLKSKAKEHVEDLIKHGILLPDEVANL